ncbi:hypothetical protein [Nesterenkonia cremea]|uniref:Asparagine synthetase domain-containing protein n=1 Tax=Nesterenkonia cremea TaxID=1882340 RepID=A0A917EQZ3_9MICC|nr:hypothetical protein [Nesterenkonia cremea]GGE68175.1 hypothetical protein GCM10011401_14490 [Nesterenkonia cremea]
MTETPSQRPGTSGESFDADFSLVPEREDFSHLHYARGYVFSRGPEPNVPSFWHCINFAEGHFHWDPRVPLARVADGKHEVLICGNAIHTARAESEPFRLAELLLSALSRGREDYLDELEDFSGQFVLFSRSDHSITVQTDAIGCRAAFHDGAAQVIASHANLVGRAVGAPPSPFNDWVARPQTHDFPGRTTAFSDVWLLMPNTEIELNSGSITRVGPRPFEPLTVAEAADEIIPHLEAQVDLLLRGSRKVLISASAGVDSRTSLASFSKAGEAVKVFTYTKAPGSGRQAAELHRDKLASEMAADLGLPHVLFDLNRAPKPPAGYVTALGESSVRRSNALTSWTYHQNLDHNAVHIRGQINGVGKWHFAKRLHFSEPLELSARRMAQLTKRGKALRKHPSSPLWTLAEEGFQDYIDTTSLRSVPNGYRLPDLFLWEHRVGYWNHAHIIESDTTFDTHQLFASRRIIRLMLSVPELDRVQLSLFREIIRRMEPSLVNYPLNGETWDEPVYDAPLSSYQVGVSSLEKEYRARFLEEKGLRKSAESSQQVTDGEKRELAEQLKNSQERYTALRYSKLGRLQHRYWRFRSSKR